jgi:hypothetical protein
MAINQAVVFTKPVHHLNISLTPDRLAQYTRAFLESCGLVVRCTKKVTGKELADKEVIRQHYLMYSKASYGDAGITDEGRVNFTAAFGKEWDAELNAGRIMGHPQLLKTKGIDADELYRLWNAASVHKIQAGLLMGWLENLDCYCINAFYPAMEANFNAPATIMDYFVVEFDPAQVSWEQFRKKVLGVTNAARAVPDSLRGQLYAKNNVEFPGRDNFVHGSAGPFEGFVERVIHEEDFDLSTNPVGQYLSGRGVTLKSFAEWKSKQSIAAIGALFDKTEEKDTDEVLECLASVRW